MRRAVRRGERAPAAEIAREAATLLADVFPVRRDVLEHRLFAHEQLGVGVVPDARDFARGLVRMYKRIFNSTWIETLIQYAPGNYILPVYLVVDF